MNLELSLGVGLLWAGQLGELDSWELGVDSTHLFASSGTTLTC